jgi:hypothetical protein
MLSARVIRFASLGCLLSLLALGSAPAQSRPDRSITVAELDAYLRFLSSDLLEGRGPGTRGESLTTAYLVSQLQAFGAKPGAAGQWLQPVSITVHDPVPDAPVELGLTGRVTRSLTHGQELRVANYSGAGSVEAQGELVFVGYGIHAPIYRWDDFAGIDLRGKIAVALQGEPALPDDSTRFNGFRASRYSWARDKQVEMERRGAVGVLWVTKNGSLSTAPPSGSRRLTSQLGGPMVFTGNVADSLVASLLPDGSGGWAALVAAAGRPGFQARPLGTELRVRFRTAPRTVVSHNVVGTITGTDPVLAREHLVVSAHWDAYGIVRPVDGDSIANGALDDGSGTIVTLALARVFARHPLPRSVTLLFTTAEEWGLLGAEAFVAQSPIPLDQVVANLNIDDGIELFGPRKDVAPLGIELSSLGRSVAAVARRQGLRVSLDPFPAEGFFLRADNYPFARAGVPALYLALGTDAVGRPKGWVDAKVKEYLERHYHRPSDDYQTVAIDLAGSRQLAEFTRELAILVGTARGRPTWNPGSEFSRMVTPLSSPRVDRPSSPARLEPR